MQVCGGIPGHLRPAPPPQSLCPLHNASQCLSPRFLSGPFSCAPSLQTRPTASDPLPQTLLRRLCGPTVMTHDACSPASSPGWAGMAFSKVPDQYTDVHISPGPGARGWEGTRRSPRCTAPSSPQGWTKDG